MTHASIHPRLAGLRQIEILGRRVPVADGLRTRLFGLAGIRDESRVPGLLIPRCRSIHTFGMDFALCVIFCDGANRALRVVPHVPPGRILACRGAEAVLELPTGGEFADGGESSIPT